MRIGTGMPRGPRTILGLTAEPKWPTPRGSAMSVACGAGLAGDAGPAGDAAPVGGGGPADGDDDAAGVVGGNAVPDDAKAVTWRPALAAPPSLAPRDPPLDVPKTVQAPKHATASAARAAITTSHLRTFQSLRRLGLLADRSRRARSLAPSAAVERPGPLDCTVPRVVGRPRSCVTRRDGRRRAATG